MANIDEALWLSSVVGNEREERELSSPKVNFDDGVSDGVHTEHPVNGTAVDS